MLRKMMYRKIIVSTSLLLVILMLYLIPTNKNERDIPNKTFEYIYPNDLEVIYLLDDNNYLSRTKISTSNKDIVSKSTDLIEALTIDGRKKDIDSTLIETIEVSMIDDSNYINKLELTNFSKVRVIREKILGY